MHKLVVKIYIRFTEICLGVNTPSSGIVQAVLAKVMNY